MTSTVEDTPPTFSVSAEAVVGLGVALAVDDEPVRTDLLLKIHFLDGVLEGE